MKSKYDLDYVVQNNQRLLDFILGEGEFLTNRPDNDYLRWLELEKYYRNLDEYSACKNMIKQSVLGLFEKHDISAKHISILLGRIMDMDEIVPTLISLIATGEVKDLPRHFEKEVYISAIDFRITEVAKKIVEYYTKNMDLIGFLAGKMGVSDFEKNIISEDDLWRVNCLAIYYEDCTESEKEEIRKQLMSAIEKYNAILYLLNAYHEKETSYKNFGKLIEESQNKFV